MSDSPKHTRPRDDDHSDSEAPSKRFDDDKEDAASHIPSIADDDASSLRVVGRVVYDPSRTYGMLPSRPVYIMHVKVDCLDPTNPSKNTLCMPTPTRKDYANGSFSWNTGIQLLGPHGLVPPVEEPLVRFLFPALSMRMSNLGPLGNLPSDLDPNCLTNGRPGNLGLATKKNLEEAQYQMMFDGHAWTDLVAYRTYAASLPVVEPLADASDPKHRDTNFLALVKKLNEVSDWQLAYCLACFSTIPRVSRVIKDVCKGVPFGQLSDDLKRAAIYALSEDVCGAQLVRRGQTDPVTLPHGIVMQGHRTNDMDDKGKPRSDAVYREEPHCERIFASARIAYPSTPDKRGAAVARKKFSMPGSAPVPGPAAASTPSAAPGPGPVAPNPPPTIAEQISSFTNGELKYTPFQVSYVIRDPETRSYADVSWPAGVPFPEGDVVGSPTCSFRVVINSKTGSIPVKTQIVPHRLAVFGLAHCQRASASVVTGMTD